MFESGYLEEVANKDILILKFKIKIFKNLTPYLNFRDCIHTR